MVQIAYRNRELTSYPKINHVFVSSKAVFTAEALSSQYQAAITLCKQSYVDTQYTIKIHNIKINPLAINLDVSGCSGANNKAQIKVKTHRPPCRFSLLSIQWYAISGFDDRRCDWPIFLIRVVLGLAAIMLQSKVLVIAELKSFR